MPLYKVEEVFTSYILADSPEDAEIETMAHGGLLRTAIKAVPASRRDDLSFFGAEIPYGGEEATVGGILFGEQVKNMRKTIEQVKQWGEDRGILAGDSNRQLLKTASEIGETCDAVAAGDVEKVVDGIGDVMVTLILFAEMMDTSLEMEVYAAVQEVDPKENIVTAQAMCEVFGELMYVGRVGDIYFEVECKIGHMLIMLRRLAGCYGYSLEECLSVAFDAIKDRTGVTTPEGVFIKEEGK